MSGLLSVSAVGREEQWKAKPLRMIQSHVIHREVSSIPTRSSAEVFFKCRRKAGSRAEAEDQGQAPVTELICY